MSRTVNLGLPSKVVHMETGVILKQLPPYTHYDMALYNTKTQRGVTTYSYDEQENKLRYPHGVVFGKLGAKFAGYIT